MATETQSRQGRFIALGLGVTGMLAIVAAIALVTPSVLEPPLESASEIADLRTTPPITLEPGSAQPDRDNTVAIGTDRVDADANRTQSGAETAEPPASANGSGDEASDRPIDRSAGDAQPGDAGDPPSIGQTPSDPAGATPGTADRPDQHADSDREGDRPAPPVVDPVMAPLATPLAAGGLGVVAASAIRQVIALGAQIGDRIGNLDWELPFTIDIRLADGTITQADVLDPGGQDTPALIRLPDEMDVDGYRPSVAEPRPDDMVTVLAEDPIVLRFADVSGLDPSSIHRGTAIIDRQGRLLGLCEHAEAANASSIRIVMLNRVDFDVPVTMQPD